MTLELDYPYVVLHVDLADQDAVVVGIRVLTREAELVREVRPVTEHAAGDPGVEQIQFKAVHQDARQVALFGAVEQQEFLGRGGVVDRRLFSVARDSEHFRQVRFE